MIDVIWPQCRSFPFVQKRPQYKHLGRKPLCQTDLKAWSAIFMLGYVVWPLALAAEKHLKYKHKPCVLCAQRCWACEYDKHLCAICEAHVRNVSLWSRGTARLWNKQEGRTGRQHPTPWESPSWCDTRPSVGLFIPESMWNFVCVCVCVSVSVCLCYEYCLLSRFEFLVELFPCASCFASGFHPLSFFPIFFPVHSTCFLCFCFLVSLAFCCLPFILDLIFGFCVWTWFVYLPDPLVSRIWVRFCVNCTSTTQPTTDYPFMVHNNCHRAP